jgi:hypothetical protein
MTAVVNSLTAVMRDVGAVGKRERNSQGNFNYRGIDAVTNAVHPALVAHGVVVVPKLLSYDYGTVIVGHKRTEMAHARLTVEFTFYGPEGDSVTAVTAGEAFDSGDKATAKAHSVALRTALLQTLCLPTDEPDPDANSYERAPQKSEQDLALDRLMEVCQSRGIAPATAATRFKDEIGADIRQADAPAIIAFAEALQAEGAADGQP